MNTIAIQVSDDTRLELASAHAAVSAARAAWNVADADMVDSAIHAYNAAVARRDALVKRVREGDKS